MLNEPVLKFQEISEGRKLPSQLEEATGVSAKSWRKGTISSKKLEEATNNAKKYNINQFRKHGASESEIKEFVDKHPGFNNASALYSSLIYEQQVQGVMEFPRTIELAGKIDSLSSVLYNAKKSNILKSFKESLRREFFTDKIFWIVEDDFEKLILDISSAKDWSELDFILKRLTVTTAISLFSHWDIEFCNQYFESYELRPLFSLVLPKIDPVMDELNIGDAVTKRRDMFWLPVRRLIDVMACINEYLRAERWPDNVPSVKDFCISVGEHMPNVINWRDGTKKFKYRDFDALWRAICKENALPNRATPPLPLFTAAIFWDIMLIQKNKLLVTGINVIDEEYYRYWAWHKNTLKEKRSGTKRWPKCLDKL